MRKSITLPMPSRRTLIAGALVAVGAAGIAFATIPAQDGTIHACYKQSNGSLRVVETAADCGNNEVALSWSQTGPAGPAGPPGPAGAGGALYYSETRPPVNLPTTYTSIEHLDLPAGRYHVTATALFNNLGGTGPIPVNCVLDGGNTSSVIAAAQLEQNGGASAATLPVSVATELFAAGTVNLLCLSNTGNGGATATAEQVQITAVSVGSISVQ